MGPQREFINYYILDDPMESPSLRSKPNSAKYSINISMNGGESCNGSGSWDSDWGSETSEGRLSRSLQSWMPDYNIETLVPLEKPPREPVFSGRLDRGRATNRKPKKLNYIKRTVSRAKTAPIRRVPSDESLVTSLSLLTCSTADEAIEEVSNQKQRRRRRRKGGIIASSTPEPPTHVPGIWVRLAEKKTGMLGNFMRSQALARGTYMLGQPVESDESEAFQLMEPDIQRQLFRTGHRRGIRLVSGLKKSNSETNLAEDKDDDRTRPSSAGAKRPPGKPIDLHEIRRQMIQKQLAEEQARLLERQQRSRAKWSMKRQGSRQSISGTSSHPHSPPSTSARSSDRKADTAFSESGSDEERVTMWKGDQEILEIDLKRDLTSKVKNKITTTTTALAKATGFGEDNRHRRVVGVHDEFPKHTEDDFCSHPRIVQKVRISPHLSNVIRDDIKVRMGRPRYHEIRIRDLEMWNKGQTLGRAHRNLKVFTWLHSLKESEFKRIYIPALSDDPLTPGDNQAFINVPAADEPEIKPLYKAYEVRIL